jgi:hypothetical protein
MTTARELIDYLSRFDPNATVWVLPQKPGASVKDIPASAWKGGDREEL